MTPFICRNCKAETWKLIEDGCPNCFRVPKNRNPHLGQTYCNKGKRVTYADAMRIMTNHKRKDGQFRPDPKWRIRGED